MLPPRGRRRAHAASVADHVVGAVKELPVQRIGPSEGAKDGNKRERASAVTFAVPGI